MRPWCYDLLKNMMCLKFIHVVWYQGEVWQAVAEGDFPNSKTCFWRTFVTHTSLSAIFLPLRHNTTIWTSDPGQKGLSSNKITKHMQRTSRTPHDTTNFRILQHFHQASRVTWRDILASSKENISGPVQCRQCKNLFVHLINPKLRRIDLVFSLSQDKMRLVVFLWTFIESMKDIIEKRNCWIEQKYLHFTHCGNTGRMAGFNLEADCLHLIS